MSSFEGKLSRKNLILVFAFIVVLIFVKSPIDASAKANSPQVESSKKTLYVGYKQYKITVSNLTKGATVTCESDNKKVAKVDKNNMVTGIIPGKATITVKIKQKGKTYKDKIAITVKNPYIKITNYADFIKVGSSKTWKAEVYGSTNTTLTWSTSDSSIATVNKQSGKLTALSVGKVIITAESGILKASKTVVVNASESTESEKEEPKEPKKGNDFVLKWDIYPEVLPVETTEQFCIVQDNLPSSPVWSVSDKNLANIDQDGWLNTSDAGTVIVTARVGNKQISASLLILTEDDYTDYLNGDYRPSKDGIGDTLEIIEEDPTQMITPIPTLKPDVTISPEKNPDPVVTEPTPKVTPKITPKPVITPTPEKNTSGYTYTTTAEGLVITSLQDKNTKNAVIPREINGKKVVGIGKQTFSNLAELQSIVIPDTVTVIETEAIKDCSNLESLTIPTSVTKMSQINGCPKLKYLTIGMEEIDTYNSYFRNCIGLERITVLEGVKEIGGFCYLSNLKEVSLPESLQVISQYAFAECISLVRINIPDGVTEIGYNAFSKCNSLTSLSISDSFEGNIDEYALIDTPIESIAGAYKYGCEGILSDTEKVLFEKAQDIIISIITPSDNNGLKALAIHDWIVKNTEYDYDNYINGTVPPESYTAEGVLIYHRAVCEGYAETFKLFMDLLNIPCEIVLGNTSKGLHGWNLVYLDGEWYHIDCTWDDSVPDQGPDYVGYTYCLIPDFIMEQTDHAWIRSNYPAANGTKWTDYVNDHLHDFN